MSEQNVELIRTTYEAFRDGDMETVGRVLAQTEWVEAAGMPYGGNYTGFEEIAGNVFGPITQDVQDFAVQPDELLVAGEDRVISLGRYVGQGAGGPVDVPFAHVWTVRDGQIARFVQYADTKLFRDAVRQ